MKPRRSRLRRWLLVAAALGIVVAAALVLARRQLVETAVRTVLGLTGASDVRMSVAQASPWKVVLDDVRFSLRTQPYTVGRVTFEREKWWAPSMGHVRVERAVVPYHADGSDSNPWAWSTYKGGDSRMGAALPAERISVDGTLVIKAAALPDQDVEIKLEAAWTEGEQWAGTVSATGKGLDVSGKGSGRPQDGKGEFEFPEIRVDLAVWQDFLQRLVVLPGGRWNAQGIVTAAVKGRVESGKVVAGGQVTLAGGTLANAERKISAKGIEFQVRFADFDVMQSEGGRLAVEELRFAEFPVQRIEAEFDFRNANQIAVKSLQARALGGAIAVAEPFNLFLDQQQLEVTVTASDLALEQILALAKDVPAEATGRVDGRVPLQFDKNGLRFGTGWLALREGTTAELQLKAAGLLTRGSDPKGTAFPVLQKVESGLLRLRVSELRLDIYPPNRPPGRSATLRVAGEPTDPTVKAPVKLDLNVNGPIERLINIGMDARVQIGGSR